MKIPMPRGCDLEAVDKIKRAAQRSFRQEHIAVFGNFLGPEISRDMVRHVLMASQALNLESDAKANDCFRFRRGEKP